MSSRWQSLAHRLSPGTGAEPESVVSLLRHGGATQVAGARRSLMGASLPWIERFLSLGGLEALFGVLERSGSASLRDTLLQVHCVDCLRAVMNARAGLDFIVREPRYTRKLAHGQSLAWGYSPRFWEGLPQ
ncbi:unnamed protein product [Ixodes pacificus]